MLDYYKLREPIADHALSSITKHELRLLSPEGSTTPLEMGQ